MVPRYPFIGKFGSAPDEWRNYCERTVARVAVRAKRNRFNQSIFHAQMFPPLKTHRHSARNRNRRPARNIRRNAAASDCIAGAAVKSELKLPDPTLEIAGFFSYPVEIKQRIERIGIEGAENF
jgi:hypothetical protein